MYTTLVFPLVVLEMMRRGADVALGKRPARPTPWEMQVRREQSLGLVRALLECESSPAARAFVARLVGGFA